MDIMDAVRMRHSVRAYKEQPLPANITEELNSFIKKLNEESGLHIQLVVDEPKAFDSLMAHYGKFSGVRNYVALIGRKSDSLDELCGYYGEKIVLKAQQLGLNSCWVAMTYKKIKTAFTVDEGEKLALVIALGYGETNGTAHKSKSLNDVTKVKGTMPDWFKSGAEAALLAPTAMNQQKFTFELDGNKVTAKAGIGFYAKVDLGIVKYHFEVGAGKENFEW